MFGAGAMTNSIPEIRDTDLIFVIGSNTTEAHPIIAMEMKRARRRGAKLYVADPRKIWLTEIADQHLQLKPGTDVWLLNAMAHVVVRDNLVHEAFIETHTHGFDALATHLLPYTPERAAVITGVDAALIEELAHAYGSTKKAGIFYTLGITEHTHGTDNVYALANLVLMTGHLGVRSAGLNPLRGQNNVQGANDAGASPVFFPGYQRVDDAMAHRKFSQAWGRQLSHTPGINLNIIMKRLGPLAEPTQSANDLQRIMGLYVMGEDIVLSEPNVERVEIGLNGIDFLVCQEIFFNETTRFADVILPAACFAEKEGVFTNSDRRVQRVRKAVDPPGNAQADWKILCAVARAAGYPMPEYAHPREIYAEMASLSPKFAGISHERIEKSRGKGVQWPCPSPEHPGTETLHQDGPTVGKARFQLVDYRPSAEIPDAHYPLVLSTGRTLYHYNAGTQTRRADGARTKQAQNFLEMHRFDAKKLGLEHGQRVKVRSRRGEVEAMLQLGNRVRPGCVWMPLHFKEARANLLTNDAGDTLTGTGEYKVCAVRVRGM